MFEFLRIYLLSISISKIKSAINRWREILRKRQGGRKPMRRLLAPGTAFIFTIFFGTRKKNTPANTPRASNSNGSEARPHFDESTQSRMGYRSIRMRQKTYLESQQK